MAPDAPSSLPKYLAEGLPKQDDEALWEAKEYIDELLAARDQCRQEPVTDDELPENSQVLETESGGTVYLEYRTCGDESCSCMSGGEKHGPYKYRAYRDGDTVRRDYLGKATETNTDWFCAIYLGPGLTHGTSVGNDPIVTILYTNGYWLLTIVNNEEWSAVQYRFIEPVNLFTAFEQTGIEHLEVSNEWTIVISSRTIFDLEIDNGSLADAQLITVDVFDVASDRSATGDPVEETAGEEVHCWCSILNILQMVSGLVNYRLSQ